MSSAFSNTIIQGWDIAQQPTHLPGKCKILSLIPGTNNKNNNKNKPNNVIFLLVILKMGILII